MKYFLSTAAILPEDKLDLSSNIYSELSEAKRIFFEKSNIEYEKIFICSRENANSEFYINSVCLANHISNIQPHLLMNNIKYPESWLQSGCWRWKPYLIHGILQKIPENSILIYNDLNVIKYKDYIDNISVSPSEYEKLLGDRSLLLLSLGYKPLCSDTKKLLFEEYNNLKPLYPGFWSGCIAIRNNNIARKIIFRWCQLSTEKNYLPLPDLHAHKRYKIFVHHSSCQAGLALLYYDNKSCQKDISVAYSATSRSIKYFRRGALGYYITSKCFAYYTYAVIRAWLAKIFKKSQFIQNKNPLSVINASF